MRTKPKVLYVDDELLNLELFEMTFEDEFRVISANSGVGAIKILDKENDIRAVITDMKMPGMNGLEFIEKASASKHDLPYFMLSGYSLSLETSKALNDGKIKAYFTKPFNKEEILKEVSRSIY